MTILPIDEINALEDRLKVHFDDDGKGRIKSRQDAEDILDEMLDLFLLSYAMGVDSVGVEQPPLETVEDTLYKRIDGKTCKNNNMASLFQNFFPYFLLF